MPTEKKCRIFKRKDGKYLMYISKALAEDSMFPFPLTYCDEVYVKVSFKIGKKELVVSQ